MPSVAIKGGDGNRYLLK